jgi:hypothetical protein
LSRTWISCNNAAPTSPASFVENWLLLLRAEAGF